MQNIYINSGRETDELFNAAFVLTDDNLDRIYGPLLPKDRFVIKAGEESKSLYNVEKITEAMLSKGVKRGDRVAAFGGGVVGDLLGFVASIYMRGIKWSFVPTSLLAMADSCVGGKTGVNIGNIKNAVGSFSMPDSFIETKYLRTLPDRERQSGIGEIVKMSLLDPDLFDFMHGRFDDAEAIKKCVRIKSAIVETDLKDAGARKSLNMGHTVGHAIELMTGFSHGKSVLIGLRLEMLMMRDYIEHSFFYEIQSYLGKFLGDLKVGFDPREVTSIAMSDKKNSDGISIMYPHALGDVREALLSEDDFLRLLTGAL